jgi:hypothetical protein
VDSLPQRLDRVTGRVPRGTLTVLMLICPALTLAACAKAEHVAGPSNTPTQMPSSSSAEDGVSVVAILSSGRLMHFQLNPRVPALERGSDLNGPVGGTASSVSIASGSNRRICAIWDINKSSVLWCYDNSGRQGRDIGLPQSEAPQYVSLSSDGARIAWIGPKRTDDGGDSDLYSAAISDRGLSAVERIPADTKHAPTPGYRGGTTPVALAWTGDNALLVTTEAESGEASPLFHVDLSTASKSGWSQQAAVIPQTRPGDNGPREYAVASSTTSDPVAIEGSDPDRYNPHTRAVILSLSDASVRKVIATPSVDRQLDSVSGGDRGYLYRTSKGGAVDVRFYWRNADEPRGRILTGIPHGVEMLIAEP